MAVRKADRAILGWSRYSPEFVEADEIEIGWTFLGRPFWGGPYNPDMKRSMCDYAFRFVPKVIFRINENNRPSRRAVERLGAQLTDRRTPSLIEGRRSTDVFYVLTPETVTLSPTAAIGR